MTDSRGDVGVAKHCHASHIRRYLLEKLQPFSAQSVLELDKASRVATWSRQSVDKSGTNRIGNIVEHNRHGARCLQQWPHGCGAGCENYVRRKRGQLSRMPANLGGSTSGPSEVDMHIAAVPAQSLQHF